MDETFSADGLVLHPNGELIAVAVTVDSEGNQVPEVLAVSSDDDWASASITSRVNTSEIQVTTAALRDEAVYVIAAHLNEFFMGESVEGFEIYRIEFEDDLSSVELCTISTDQARTVRVRVGYGENRTSITMLKADTDFEVLGQNTDDNDAVWYALDKEQAATGKSIQGDVAWVADAEIDATGACDAVAIMDASGIIPIVVVPTPAVEEASNMEVTPAESSESKETTVVVPTGATVFSGRRPNIDLHGGVCPAVVSSNATVIFHFTAGGGATEAAAIDAGNVSSLLIDGASVNVRRDTFPSSEQPFLTEIYYTWVRPAVGSHFITATSSGSAVTCNIIVES